MSTLKPWLQTPAWLLVLTYSALVKLLWTIVSLQAYGPTIGVKMFGNLQLQFLRITYIWKVILHFLNKSHFSNIHYNNVFMVQILRRRA